MTASSRAECKRLRLGAACGATDIGLVREANEDSFLLDDALSLLIVADGMGGHVAGAMASAEAIVAMQSFLRTWLDRATGADADATVPHEGMGARMACGGGGAGLSPCRQDQAAHALRAAVESANAQVFGINVAHRHAQGDGMGTTLTGLWQFSDRALGLFHVGDSRIYRCRGGSLVALTHDQTMYQQALDAGFTADLPPSNLLWQALGPHAAVTPDITMLSAEAGDLYLLCSDGLHGAVPDSLIATVLATTSHDALGDACARLIALAKRRGSRDNITVVLARCGA